MFLNFCKLLLIYGRIDLIEFIQLKTPEWIYLMWKINIYQ